MFGTRRLEHDHFTQLLLGRLAIVHAGSDGRTHDTQRGVLGRRRDRFFEHTDCLLVALGGDIQPRQEVGGLDLARVLVQDGSRLGDRSRDILLSRKHGRLEIAGLQVVGREFRDLGQGLLGLRDVATEQVVAADAGTGGDVVLVEFGGLDEVLESPAEILAALFRDQACNVHRLRVLRIDLHRVSYFYASGIELAGLEHRAALLEVRLQPFFLAAAAGHRQHEYGHTCCCCDIQSSVHE